MDPLTIAQNSADLNLRLMKWRQLPDLNTEKLFNTKCLIIGTGTLGCHVGRSLIGWGVRHITFVDNGRVSYSNPLRQPLFLFDDCLNGGQYKSIAAANNIKKIFPGIDSKGIVMTIPMPGHQYPENINLNIENNNIDINENENKNDNDGDENNNNNNIDPVYVLDSLIRSHDVIFLLTDSRESRWLPTLIAKVYDKMLINAALGFDNYLVMRHGGLEDDEINKNDNKLNNNNQEVGCYFCTDVMAPIDSLSNRTLDQQCTITRPGLAPMASASAVELMVSLLHYPDEHHAKCPTKDFIPKSNLGLIPHQLRYFLSKNELITPMCPSFINCCACSNNILNAFKERGLEFVKEICETPELMEEISGLKALKDGIDFDDFDFDEIDDDDEFFNEEDN